MNRKYRIALGGFMTECNHLGGRPTDITRFELGELRRGDEVLGMTSGGAAGMLSILHERGAEVVPLLLAEACPGGPLTRECYDTLKTELLERLAAALPVDAVLLSLHGSAAVEDEDDPEGDLLQAVRGLVGEGVPIGASLDTHANVTARMVTYADALAGFATYPHVDGPDTGARVARMILQMLDGTARPVMALAKVPVLVSGVLGHTQQPGPFADVMRLAKEFEGDAEVLSTSVFLVHPYLDVPDMGGGGVVITDGNAEKAEELARCIALAYWEKRFDLEPVVHAPQEAIAEGLKISGGPVILAEVADCAGGGATGDSVHTLRALLEMGGNATALIPVVDPEAAALCASAGEGAEITLQLGHKLTPKFGTPITVTGQVRRVGDGQFRYTGGFWEGQFGEMGTSAVLQVGPISILITTNATYEWADEQFQVMGLEARDVKFVVAKNPMNYRLAYRDIARGAFILATAGATPATLRGVTHEKRARPYYPADVDIPDLEPVVSIHQRS